MTEMQCAADESVCHCLLSDVMDLLGRKYVLDIVCVVAAHGRVRFGDVADHIPNASTSTLSTRFDELVAAGLLTREQYDEIPPRVEYELTPAGEELGERLRPLLAWADEYELPD